MTEKELLNLERGIDLASGTDAGAKAFFGPDPDASFRLMSKKCHPDLNRKYRSVAERVFSKLSALRDRLNGKTPAPAPTLLGNYVVLGGLAGGDVSDVYRATNAEGTAQAVLKISRDAADNDLMEREVQALKLLAASKLDVRYQKYIPRFREKFKAGGRQVNAIDEVVEGYTLSQLPDIATIDDFRHVVWMFNRLSTALGFLHRNDLAHGAVTPDHLIYIPESHGLVLIDYTAATKLEDGQKIPYMSDAWEGFYPPELKRGMFGEETDVYMAARCMQHLVDRTLDGEMPRRFRAILEHCMAASPHSRPGDAWKVQQQWKDAAKELYGPPKFLEMKVAAQ